MEYPGTLLQVLIQATWAESKEKEPTCNEISRLVYLRVAQLAAPWKAYVQSLHALLSRLTGFLVPPDLKEYSQ